MTERSDLPAGWCTATLGDVTQINPSLPRINLDDETEVTFLAMKSVEEETGRFDTSVTRTLETVKRGYTSFVDGDVIFAKITPCMENGKIAVVRNLKNGIGFGSTEFHVLRAEAGILNQFLFLYLVQKSFRHEAQSKMTGSAGQKRVPTAFVGGTHMPIPPINEQQRIVSRVEEIFTQLNAAVEELRKAQAHLKRYRQAVLKAAVTGELTREWREAHKDELEPASELLVRILAERRAKWEKDQLAKMTASGRTAPSADWQRKYSEPKSPKPDGIDLPNGWFYASAEQLTSVITDGEHITPERADSGVLLLSARNIRGGELSLDKVDYVPERVYQNLAKRLTIDPGDVMLSCSGSVGRSCVAPPNLRFALVRSVAVLKPLSQMGSFISYALRSPYLQAQIEEKKTQTAQANIFQGKIRKLVFLLPSLAEQQRIVEEVERLTSIADNTQRMIEAGLVQAERLRQGILKQAFEGKLVPQDPNDEPAELLLERIKTERAKREADKQAEAKSNRKRSTKKLPKRTERPAA